MEFENSNPTVKLAANAELPGVTHFNINGAEAKNVHSFAKLYYKDLYDNIDMVLYAKKRPDEI